MDKWKLLLGKKVRVTLEHGHSDQDKKVVVEGTLLAFDEGGEARVQQEDGFVCFCWPMLDVEEI